VPGHDLPLRNADLAYRLRGLGMAGSVLHIGSHPDDEDAGLMAYLSRGIGVRTVYWSATRGEGGQNRIGPERAEALGVLRTWESLDARALDGGEVLYGPFYDFGFSRSGEDCLVRWDEEIVLLEMVRAIRLVQPRVVVSRWTGGPEDGHGQHQAIGLVVAEAFRAAAERTRFPELLAQGLGPWQAQKLYRSAAGDWQPGEDAAFGQRSLDLEADGLLRINTGEVDPVSGRSYEELARMGVNRHQSQAMALLPARGDHFSYYRLERSLVPAPQPEQGFFDGFDPTLAGLADHLGDSVPLRALLDEARDHAVAAVDVFRPDRPADAGRAVLEGLASLRAARKANVEASLGEDARSALDRAIARKIGEFEETAGRCLGIDVDCLVDEARVTPGREVRVRARVWTGKEQLDSADVRLEVPEGWVVRHLDVPPGRRDDSEVSSIITAEFEVSVPDSAVLSCPYWLRDAREPYRYAWPASGPLALPFDPPLITARCEVELGGHRLSITRTAVHREAFVGGSRELPLEIVPPVSFRLREQRKILPLRESEEHIELQLAARSMRDDVRGTFAAEAPHGWEVHPAEVELAFPRVGDVHTLEFELTVPTTAKPGIHELSYRMTSGQRDYSEVVQPVWRRAPGLAGPADESNCIAEAFIMAPATVSVHLIEAEFVRTLRYAYIRGAEEDVLKSLESFGLDVKTLASEELSYADLSVFDTIVVGPNAYLVREGVRRNAARLLEYVDQGGTLIVQYQAYGYQRPGFAPYPFGYRQPHDRVTSPDASVTVLEPDHPGLSVPNRITPEDFNGWVQDRGLYFFGERDKRYVPLLESADPGQEPLRGGLLVASYGRGTYVYAAYSFFRQIPEGVPGAVRLFANLLGLAEARILERVERVRHIPLFSFLNDTQMYEVARLMSERWLDPGTYLCRQGDRGRELYMVLDGEVEVIKGKDGGEELLQAVGPGELLGELSVLTDLPRSATLRARDEVKVLVMQGSHFRDFLRQHADLSERVTSLLARRLASSEIRW
jgi:LmbE family N-acetylglucosaminyl deacetylase